MNSWPSCAQFVGRDACPLAATTRCSLRGNRIRIAQHTHTDRFSAGPVTSSKRAQERCSILDLPCEIRDAIYDYLIPIHQDITLSPLHLDFDTRTSHWHPNRSPRKEPNHLSLLCTSKQIHHEVASRLFSANRFHVTCWILRDGRIAPAPTRLVPTFGFTGLMPLHPAYAQLLTSVTVFARGGWKFNYGETLRIANPARCRHQPDDPPPEHGEDAIDRFIATADRAAQSMVRCKCLRFIPLGNATYTLRRPPGPERERCKAGVWQKVQHHHGATIRAMQKGRFARKKRARRPEPDWMCFLVLVVRALCAILYHSVMWVCVDGFACLQAKVRRWRAARRREQVTLVDE